MAAVAAPRTLTVPAGAAPERVDRYLARALSAETSRSQVARWIKAGDVRRNGRPVTPAAHVRPGDVLTVAIPPPQAGVAPEPMPLDILYEDDALLVVNKPAGLVVHPGAGHATGTLVHGLLAHTRQLSQTAGPLKPGIVHRLDKDTSGVMVVAKTDAAHRALAAQFAARTVQKTYLAFVRGVVPRERGVIAAALGRHPKDRQRFAVRPEGQGRDAVTAWRVVRRWPTMTLLELTPQTGRTHQLRVHLAHLGFPIVGDPCYGRVGASAPIRRQALHATCLSFLHPVTGKRVAFTAPLPPDLAALEPSSR